MPIFKARQALITRTAISERLAIRIFLIIGQSKRRGMDNADNQKSVILFLQTNNIWAKNRIRNLPESLQSSTLSGKGYRAWEFKAVNGKSQLVFQAIISSYPGMLRSSRISVAKAYFGDYWQPLSSSRYFFYRFGRSKLTFSAYVTNCCESRLLRAKNLESALSSGKSSIRDDRAMSLQKCILVSSNADRASLVMILVGVVS